MEGVVLMIQLLLDIELDDKYFEIAKEIIDEAKKQDGELMKRWV